MWFADFTPSTVTSRVRAVTSGAGAQGRVPVVVAYAIPDRDCGGASEGGAPDLAAYDGWVDRFAAGLGSGEVVVILEPDSIAQADCLSEGGRADRFASLARAGRVLKAADPNARVYYDAGHSGWNAAADAGESAEAGGRRFGRVLRRDLQQRLQLPHHARRDRLRPAGPRRPRRPREPGRRHRHQPQRQRRPRPTATGATRRAARSAGRPTTQHRRGPDRRLSVVKLPGESDGCKGSPGTFTPSYAYELASS